MDKMPVDLATAIVSTILGTLLIQRLLDHFRSADRIALLEFENSTLKKELADLKSKDTESQQTILDLEARYAANYSDAAIRAKYSFDYRTATRHVEGTPGTFCHRCLLQNPPIESEMSQRGDEWTCLNCGTKYA